MLLSDALAQHEGILRANGDDERGAECKAVVKAGPNMTRSVLAPGDLLHLNFLRLVKQS